MLGLNFCRHAAVAIVSLVTVSTARTALASGGHSENGGGGVMVCRNTSDPKESQVILLDLWEAETVRGLDIDRSGSGSAHLDQVEQEAYRYLSNQKLDRELRDQIANEVRLIVQHMRNGNHKLPKGVIIAPPTDGGNGFTSKNCELRGVGLYDHVQNNLFIDEELFSRMSLTDKTALILHEASYKVFREWFFAENSVGTRRFIGCLMTKGGCSDLQVLPAAREGKKRAYCVGAKLSVEFNRGARPVFEFYYDYMNSGNIYFTRYNGHPLPARASNNEILLTWGPSLEGDPVTVNGKTFKAFLGPAYADQPVIISSPNGQSLSMRYSATVDPNSPIQLGMVGAYHFDGTPIVCQW